MKKILFLLIVLIAFSSSLFAVETFWCLNATQNIDTTVKDNGRWSEPRYTYKYDAYRFNYSTVFDLSTSFSGTPKYSDFAGLDSSTGQPNGKPLDESRAIGTVGVGGCEHEITYTITALNNGEFHSQSDPSKFRKYYVVFVPDYSTTTSATSRYYYYYDTYTSSSSNAPSTKGGNSITFVAPATNGSYYHSSGYISSIGLDLFLCMDDPSSELGHMAQNDDYIATIQVSWQCSYGCPNHQGTFDMVVRGYYGSNSGEDRDSFLLLVNPAADVNTLDLKAMIKENQTKTLSTMTIATTTREGTSGSAYAWRDHIYTFLSASSNYLETDYTGFVLTKTTNRSITIPYTLTVYNTTPGSPMEGKVYNGTDHYIENNHSYCFDLRDYSKASTDYYAMSYDRYGTYYYAINYSGRVDINLTNFTIPGTSVDIRTVMNDPVTYHDEYSRYIGKYESNIYYHIVHDGTTN